MYIDVHVDVHLFIATNFSISANHFRANSSSENLPAATRALWRTAKGSGKDRAFSKPSANSDTVVAWKPRGTVSDLFTWVIGDRASVTCGFSIDIRHDV